jgi:hypothetical protein
MTASLAWQYAVIALLVAWSALQVLRKYLPSVWGRALALIAALLQKTGLGLFVRAGQRLQAAIPASVGSSCGSDGGCSSCGACGSSTPEPPAALVMAEPKPLQRR